MSNKAKREYVEAIRDRYRQATRRGKQRILDELCQVCRYNRKYAIRLLNAPPPSANAPSQHRAGRIPQYW